MISLNKKGVISIICSAFFFSLMSLFVRLAGDMPIFQKCFFRNFVALIVVTILMLIKKEKFLPKKETFPFIMGRSIFGLIGIVLNFLAITNLNIADASILNKLSPFFAVLFSAIFIKEKINKYDIAMLVLAFIGALFVIKPTMNVNNVYSYGGLVGGISVGIAYTFLRMVGLKGDKGTKTVFWFSLISTIVFTPLMIIFFKPISIDQLVFMCLAGTSACFAQFFVTKAYNYASAKEISVFDYTQVIFTAILGLIFLNQKPDIYSFIGYAIILVASIIKWYTSLDKTKTTLK